MLNMYMYFTIMVGYMHDFTSFNHMVPPATDGLLTSVICEEKTEPDLEGFSFHQFNITYYSWC